MAQQQQRSSRGADQAFLNSAFAVYAADVRKAISKQKSQLDQLRAAHDQLQQTIDSLEQLPAKLRHEIMVPLGKHAFFPGHLTRTNEITVHLGDQYYVEVTAGHAKGILQRKQAAVADGISKAQQQLKALQARLDVSGESLGGPADVPEAREIRSSLAESDALLASARPKASSRAAAGQSQPKVVQQQQRVKSSSGYSYTRPEGTSTVQRTAAQDAEDAALQARLEQLLLMEQQEESLDQPQDLQQQAGLDTIQEDEEEEEQEPAGAGVAALAGSRSVAGVPQSAVSSGAAQPSALDRLQQLEDEPDSDDEDDAAADMQQPQQQPQLQQRQQQQQQAGQQQLLHSRQQQQQQVQQVSQQQPRQPLKSALKKGFLGPPAPSASSSSTARPSSSGSKGAAVVSQRPAAFTGTIVERATADVAPPSAVVPAVPVPGAVLERSVAGAGSQPVADSSKKPMSKFKLRRLGLDPQDDCH